MRAIASELLLSIAFGAGAFAQTADLAVRQGRILAVSDDVSRYVGPSTKVIGAKGATILPGLIDSHGHVRNLGDELGSIDLRGVGSETAVVEKVGAAARGRVPGEWIRGSAWTDMRSG